MFVFKHFIAVVSVLTQNIMLMVKNTIISIKSQSRAMITKSESTKKKVILKAKYLYFILFKLNIILLLITAIQLSIYSSMNCIQKRILIKISSS